MFLTIIKAIKIIFYMIKKTIFVSPKIKRLESTGQFIARDELVQETVRGWAEYVIKTAGGRVQVSGLENVPQEGACVFIANHQSDMDIPLLFGFIKKHKTFVAKYELSRVPILALWMRFLHCTFIKRGNIKASLLAIKEAVQNIQKGYSLVIFPEGTRSKGGAAKDFKAGSFKLAFESGVPIVPVTINGTWHLLEEKHSLQSADISLVIHKSIATKDLPKEKRQEVVQSVQNTVLKALPPPQNKGV